jgi:F-box domain
MRVLYMLTASGSGHLLNSLAAMLFLELPDELIEQTLAELHPMEVVGLRQVSQFVASFCHSPERAADLSCPPIPDR